jgi:hypothetical protein
MAPGRCRYLKGQIQPLRYYQARAISRATHSGCIARLINRVQTRDDPLQHRGPLTYIRASGLASFPPSFWKHQTQLLLRRNEVFGSVRPGRVPRRLRTRRTGYGVWLACYITPTV